MRLRKSLSVILTIILVFVLAGCSDFLVVFNTRKATRYAEEFIESVNGDFDSALQSYSNKPIEAVTLTKEQEELYSEFGATTFELDSVELTDTEEITEAVCKVKITFKDISEVVDDNPFATLDGYTSKFKKLKKSHDIFKLKMVYSDGQWKFKDLNEIYSMTTLPYSLIVIVDDLGVPLNPNADFYKDSFVTSLWYDPLTSLPLDGTSMTKPIAIQCGFYFDRPVTNTFKVHLYEDGKEIFSEDVTADSAVLIICDFSTRLLEIDEFSKSEYTVKLKFDEQIIASSPCALTVK